ncbi:MAG: DUF4860 domain-containing protein [Acetatifactor sp.]
MKRERDFIVDVLFVLALFGVFTISALALVSIGAGVYQNTVNDMSRNYDSRTAIAYLSEKVRKSDSLLSDGSPAVTLGTLEEQPALILREELNDVRYCTYLYLHNGFLKELFVREDSYLGNHMLDAGQDIIELQSLKYEQISDNLLSVTMTIDEKETRQLYLSLRCR